MLIKKMKSFLVIFNKTVAQTEEVCYNNKKMGYTHAPIK